MSVWTSRRSEAEQRSGALRVEEQLKEWLIVMLACETTMQELGDVDDEER